MAYDCEVHEIVKLERCIRACRDTLIGQLDSVSDLVRRECPAAQQFHRLIAEMMMLAAAVEARGRLMYGDDAWEKAMREEVETA